jgi:hypothetical protein
MLVTSCARRSRVVRRFTDGVGSLGPLRCRSRTRLQEVLTDRCANRSTQVLGPALSSGTG